MEGVKTYRSGCNQRRDYHCPYSQKPPFVFGRLVLGGCFLLSGVWPCQNHHKLSSSSREVNRQWDWRSFFPTDPCWELNPGLLAAGKMACKKWASISHCCYMCMKRQWMLLTSSVWSKALLNVTHNVHGESLYRNVKKTLLAEQYSKKC